MAELSKDRLLDRYGERIHAARRQLALTWRWENHTRPSVILSDVNYAMCGQRDIPENYFDPPVMFGYQREKIVQHLQNIHDDYVPVFHPWYGTTVVSSALGVPVRYSACLDPSLEGSILRKPEDVLSLEKPNPETDGQMPLVLACIDYMKDHTDLPVCVTDCQGPFSIALSLAGAERLFTWMYQEPQAVHSLMQFCTDVLIDWVQIQKKHAGHSLSGDAYPHAIEMPAGCGGVAFSDDDLIAVGAQHYADFVIPYNQKLLDAFGGGSIHFCGSARHQLDAISNMRGLRAVNNFSLCDFDQTRMLLEKMRGKGAVMACDFNADQPAWHAEKLIELSGQPEGLILGVFFAPTMSLLKNGKYAGSARDTRDLIGQYAALFEQANLLPRHS